MDIFNSEAVLTRLKAEEAESKESVATKEGVDFNRNIAEADTPTKVETKAEDLDDEERAARELLRRQKALDLTLSQQEEVKSDDKDKDSIAETESQSSEPKDDKSHGNKPQDDKNDDKIAVDDSKEDGERKGFQPVKLGGQGLFQSRTKCLSSTGLLP